MEKRVQEVAAIWANLDGRARYDAKLQALLKPRRDAWMKFWIDWQGGRKDEENVNSMIADANGARAEALKINVQDDPRRVKNVALEDQSKSKARAVAVDEAAAAVGINPGGEWKIVAGVVGLAGLLVAAILRR